MVLALGCRTFQPHMPVYELCFTTFKLPSGFAFCICTVNTIAPCRTRRPYNQQLSELLSDERWLDYNVYNERPANLQTSIH